MGRPDSRTMVTINCRHSRRPSSSLRCKRVLLQQAVVACDQCGDFPFSPMSADVALEHRVIAGVGPRETLRRLHPLTRPRGGGVDVDWRSVPAGRQDDGRFQRRIGRRRSHVDGIPARRREPDAVGPSLVRIGLEVRERMVRERILSMVVTRRLWPWAQVHLLKAHKPVHGCGRSPRAGPDQRWCPPNDWGRNASWWYWQYRRMDSQRPTPEARQRDAILRASRGLNCVLSPSIWSHRSNGRSVGCKTALTRDQPLGLRSRPRSHRTLNTVCILQPSVRPGKH